jgi:hypothetical protein
MEFFQGIVAQARDAAGSHQSTHKVRLPFLIVRSELSYASCVAECPVRTRSRSRGQGKGESQG